MGENHRDGEEGLVRLDGGKVEYSTYGATKAGDNDGEITSAHLSQEIPGWMTKHGPNGGA